MRANCSYSGRDRTPADACCARATVSATFGSGSTSPSRSGCPMRIASRASAASRLARSSSSSCRRCRSVASIAAASAGSAVPWATRALTSSRRAWRSATVAASAPARACKAAAAKNASLTCCRRPKSAVRTRACCSASCERSRALRASRVASNKRFLDSNAGVEGGLRRREERLASRQEEVRVHHVGLILRQTLNADSRQAADGDVAQPQLGLLHQQPELSHPWIRFDRGPLERGEFKRARRRCRRLCRRRAGKQEHEPENGDRGTANGARCTHGRKALRKNGASSLRRRSMNCSNPF